MSKLIILAMFTTGFSFNIDVTKLILNMLFYIRFTFVEVQDVCPGQDVKRFPWCATR